VLHCKHGSGRRFAPAWPRMASLPRMPRAKEEALATVRTVIPHRPTVNVSLGAADTRGGLGVRIGPAGVLARSLVMITVAAFAILVLLPAAVAAQATAPI
jgi:hypothetical protein